MKESKAVLNDFMIEVLNIVLDKPGIMKSELYDGRTQKGTIDALLEYGLIVETKHGTNNKKTIEITDKGLSILRKMLEIRAELNGELVPRSSDHPGASPQDDAMPEALD